MSEARGSRRILLIAYYFPPLAGSGVFRPLRLARYLPRHGWDTTVVTVESRFLTVTDNFLQEIGVDFRDTGGAGRDRNRQAEKAGCF